MNNPRNRSWMGFGILVFFLLLPGKSPAAAGDRDGMEPGLKSRADVLFFSGFEDDPWPSAWGMAWGPQPLNQGRWVTGAEAFNGHSLQVTYPKGTIGSQGGFQFLTDFAKLSLQPRDSLYLRYYVRFEPGFDFVKGGKLPGLAGGAANTGGHKPNGSDGWSARVMWRADGKIVQYVYHPDQAGVYGEDFPWNEGGCPRFFTPGKWQCLETYVKLNTPGKRDGIIRSWLDGELALNVTNLRFRDVPTLKIDKMYFDTFFGGGDPSWATPRDQTACFDDFVMAENYIGPDEEKINLGKAGPEESNPGSASSPAKGTLVFDGDSGAWAPSGWTAGKYDFNSMEQNHSGNGRASALIRFPDKDWGGAQFAGPESKALDYKTISLWVLPTGCNVEFRVRLELNGSQVGLEKPVTAGPRHGWKVGQWNLVQVPLADFQVSGSFNRVVLTSNSSQAVSPFYVDDIVLTK